ncbi:hypothetical protein GCM10022212_03190 [Actimicrobium antarcticum]|uniref:Uncharacterized protein n=1 Tax=Actimicrobium antarcticum TaxID=1051899 RepID=A0ABP7SK34_9BURK
MVVTGAFNGADTGVAGTADDALAGNFACAFDPAFGAVLVGVVGVVVDLVDDDFSVAAGWGDFPDAALACAFNAAGLPSLTGDITVFSVFFIAFAIDQLPKGCSLCAT